MNAPEPILFNALKHHAGHIARFTDNFGPCSANSKSAGNIPEKLKNLDKELKVLGQSQMDLYFGKLTTNQIFHEIITYLDENNLSGREEYMSWINSASGAYRDTDLSDGSRWILLPGKESGRHVHIHPGRYSPGTLRVRSETMKTVIALLCYCRYYKTDPNDLSVINETRKIIFGLSPVRELRPGRGLARIIEIMIPLIPSL